MADSPLVLALTSVIGLLAIGIAAALWLSERSLSSPWSLEPVGTGTGATNLDEHQILLLGCERISKRYGLTDRETEVLEKLVEGKSCQQICQELMLSANTVKTHSRHAYAKLGVHTRSEAILLAREAED